MPLTIRTLALLPLVACSAEVEPAGWSPRFDEAGVAHDPDRIVRVDGGGIEIAPGPNATLWHPERSARGDYRLAVDVTHLDSGLHAHGAGLAFGGIDVRGDAQRYTYFLVRGDGMFLIKTRAGADTAVVAGWSVHEAVHAEDSKGVAHNRLEVAVRGDRTVFSVNGTEVHRAPTADLHTDGRYGYRTVHDLLVRFGEIELESPED